MYYTAVFLGGEWGKTDFTVFGKCLCVFFCAIGIALFGIPVGAIFEAFGETIGKKQEQAPSPKPIEEEQLCESKRE